MGFYVAGDKHRYPWHGVCETVEGDRSYIYHLDWPVRGIAIHRPQPGWLQKELAAGRWKPMWPSAVQVPPGM